MKGDYRVFISSTSDLAPERAEAIRAVLAANCTPVSMENWAATSARPTERIVEKLTTCQFFVLMAGFRYGDTVEESGKSYVALEYDEAVRLGLSIIVFVKYGASAEIDPLQQQFLHDLMRRHTTQTWSESHEIGRLVLGSLFEIVVRRQSAFVFDVNASLADQVHHYLSSNAQPAGTRKAYVIQYTGVNALDLVRRLVGCEVETYLFVISPESKHIISGYQLRRLKENIEQMRNRLEFSDRTVDLDSLLHLYAYDAPGSVRGLLLDRVTPGGMPVHEIVAYAPYLYMQKSPEGESIIDIRGGEIPGVLLNPTHDGFDVVARTIESLVKNWVDNGIARPIPLHRWRAKTA